MTFHFIWIKSFYIDNTIKKVVYLVFYVSISLHLLLIFVLYYQYITCFNSLFVL